MNILAIGAHPDDVEFGCGGALVKYSAARHNVYILILTNGSYGADPQVRIREAESAARFLGVKKLYWGGFEDTELTDNRDLILKIENVVTEVKPDIVLINHPDDVHQDHRAAALTAISATRYIKEVLFFEVPTTQRFDPDIFVDIADVLEMKLKVLQLHASQVDRTKVENLSILESAQSCATFRGYQGRVKYAEGFKAVRLLREIKAC
jgi:LmbE family N-acetylglucosaminyl deacetylase